MKRLAPLLVAAGAALLFLPFLPDRVWAWDPLQFALGLERFDMAFHQPHPPGYLGHLAIAWLFHAAGMPTDRAVQAASLVAAAAAAGVLFALGRRLYSWREGLWAAALFATNPLTWTQATSGESYPAEALAACLLVLAGVTVVRDSPRRALAGFFLLYGLLGGVRQSVPLFFLPFAAWRLREACRGRTAGEVALRIVLAGACAIAGLAAWMIPLGLLGGGLAAILGRFGTQFFQMFGATYSPLMGASAAGVRTNLDLLWRYTATVGVPAAAVAVLLLPAALGRIRGAGGRPGVYLAWLIPPFVWFVAMFAAKPGHLLMIAPPLALATARVVPRALPEARRLLSTVLLAALVATQAVLFFAPPAAWSASISASSWPATRYGDLTTESLLDGLERQARGDPSSLLVLARDGEPSFRTAMYYLPEVHVTWLMDPGSTGVVRGPDACDGWHHAVRCASGAGFWERWDLPPAATLVVPASVRRIAWLVGVDDPFLATLQRTANPDVVPAGRYSRLLVSDLGNGPFRLDIPPWTFVRPAGTAAER